MVQIITDSSTLFTEHEAKEMGINLICGGHYFTENIVCGRLEMLVKNFDSGIHTEIFESNVSFCV